MTADAPMYRVADNDTVAAWIERECQWAVKHGIKISVADDQA